MAQPTTARFGKFRVLLGNGASPTEAFAAPCGFTSRSLVLNNNTQDVNIPDCDDPDAVSWVGRDIQSRSATISGEGVVAKESVDEWFAAFDSVTPTNCKVELEFDTIQYTYTGPFHINSLTIAGEDGQRVTLSVEMVSDGALVRTSATPA